MNRLIIAAVLTTLLAGCASTPEVDFSTMAPAGITAATITKGSKFDRLVTIQGPVMRYTHKVDPNDYLSDIDFRNVALRAFKGKGEITFQIYAEIEYVSSRWRYYNTVSFEGGKSAKVLPIDRRVANCSARCNYVETLGIDVAENDLRGTEDFEFRINGRSGVRDVITVPRTYIDGFLAALPTK